MTNRVDCGNRYIVRERAIFKGVGFRWDGETTVVCTNLKKNGARLCAGCKARNRALKIPQVQVCRLCHSIVDECRCPKNCKCGRKTFFKGVKQVIFDQFPLTEWPLRIPGIIPPFITPIAEIEEEFNRLKKECKMTNGEGRIVVKCDIIKKHMKGKTEPIAKDGDERCWWCRKNHPLVR